MREASEAAEIWEKIRYTIETEGWALLLDAVTEEKIARMKETMSTLNPRTAGWVDALDFMPFTLVDRFQENARQAGEEEVKAQE